jgi:hypothetical protein
MIKKLVIAAAAIGLTFAVSGAANAQLPPGFKK